MFAVTRAIFGQECRMAMPIWIDYVFVVSLICEGSETRLLTP